MSALYDVGCTAELRQVERYDDGRFDLITVGQQRFRLRGLGEPDPYFTGDVELMPDDAGDEDEAALAVPAVQQAFRSYLEVLTERGGAQHHGALNCQTSRCCCRSWWPRLWSSTCRISSGCWRSQTRTAGCGPSARCWPGRRSYSSR